LLSDSAFIQIKIFTKFIQKFLVSFIHVDYFLESLDNPEAIIISRPAPPQDIETPEINIVEPEKNVDEVVGKIEPSIESENDAPISNSKFIQIFSSSIYLALANWALALPGKLTKQHKGTHLDILHNTKFSLP